MRAYSLFRGGKVEAADTRRSYLRAHPGDPDALYLLGESMYHGREIRAQPPESIEAPFEHVLAIDSTLAPALIHPLELAVLYRDSLRFSRYISLLRTAAPPATGATWHRAEQALRGNRAVADSLIRRGLAVDGEWWEGVLAGCEKHEMRAPGATERGVVDEDDEERHHRSGSGVDGDPARDRGAQAH